ncbi:MAG: hypothetical protein U5K69_01465 [Balneolaceae bacterium]|nr:hypothetical protein [Balneolaceae bacterium]
MKSLTLLVTLLLAVNNSAESEKWGVTGHRTVGEIAEQYLTPLAKMEIKSAPG